MDTIPQIPIRLRIKLMMSGDDTMSIYEHDIQQSKDNWRAALKEKMVQYATGIFSEKMTKFGFLSYNSENLSWYRVVNHQVLQTVYFFTEFRFPFLVSIGYGVHPLYIPAPLPQKFYIPPSAVQDTEVMWWLREAVAGKHVLYENTSINCLDTPDHGAEWLDKAIFPVFQELKTERLVYEYWLSIYSHSKPKVSQAFLDQVIYQGDDLQYSWCAQIYRTRYDNMSAHTYKDRRTLELLAKLKPQLEALEMGKRDEYLAVLEERKKKFVKKLESKLGIEV